VSKGKDSSVGIEVKDLIRMMVKTSEKDMYKPELVIDDKKLKDGTLQAPVKNDAVVGHVNLVRTEGTDYGYIDSEQFAAEVVTTEAVEKAGWFSLTMRAIGDFIGGIWNSSIDFIKGLFK